MSNGKLTNEERNEEAHGQWEFAIIRLAALAEAGAPRHKILKAVREEREAYKHWQRVSREVTLVKGDAR